MSRASASDVESRPDARRGPVSRRRRWARVAAGPGRLAVSLLCLGVSCTLATLAYASPPDPTWVSGLYDDGDADGAILSATSIVGVLACGPPALPSPRSTSGEPSPVPPACRDSLRPCSDPIRAPPAA